MNEKQNKEDFHIHKDKDEKRIWVCLPDGRSKEEVEPLNLMTDESEEFNEVTKKYILNGMRDLPSVSSTSWHTTSCGYRMGNSRYSISPMID